MTTPTFDDPPFIAALLAALAEHAPLTAGELAARIGESDDEVADELDYRPDVFGTKQGWYSVLALADGATLTHRVTAEELALGVLCADGDLDLWSRLADDGLPYAGGGELSTIFYTAALLPTGATVGLAGPAGWLDGVHEGDLLALRLQAGVLTLTQLEALPTPVGEGLTVLLECARTAADAAALEEHEDGPGALLDDVVLQALIRQPDLLLEPLPPLAALLMATDLEVHQGLVGLPGTNWGDLGASAEGLDPADLRRSAAIHAALAVTHPDEATDLVALRSALDLLAVGGPPLELLALDLGRLQALHPRVQALVAAAESPSQRAVAAFLLAVLAELDGRALEAQAHLDTALELSPDLAPALLMAADFASDRSDAPAADRLYELAGHDKDSPWRWALTDYLKPPTSIEGRNKPCACGSGRKTKICCGPTQPRPLAERARWRYQRAVLWALLPAQQETLLELAEVLAGPAASPQDFQDALAAPVIASLALVEEGLLKGYLHQRGPLMPPDERALVESWLTTKMELWEVQSTRPGFDVTVRALPDGEPVTVRAEGLSLEAERTDLLLGRLLSDSESLRFLTPPTLIPRLQRTQLLDALDTRDPYDLLVAMAPGPLPELVNTEGEPIVMCTARFSVPAGTWSALASDLDDDDGELIELVSIGDDLVQSGRFRQVDGGLELSTNSVERMARLTGRLLAVAPGATLLEQTEVPAAELMTSESALPGGLSLSPSIPAPVEAGVMAQLALMAEQRWLADSIPALDGMTPRAAAGDPVMRPRLIALLDDFAWQERNSSQPPLMQAARLRGALGLLG